MLSRRIVMALLGVTLVVASVGCSDDDSEGGGDTTTTAETTSTGDDDSAGDTSSSSSSPADPETSTSEPTTDTSASTDGSTTSAPSGDGTEEECAGYQDIATATEAIDDLGDDWAAIQADYPDLAGDVIAGIDRASSGADASLAADLEVMRGLIEDTIDLVATSSSLDDFVAQVGALPGSDAADDAADRVEDAAEERCGIDI